MITDKDIKHIIRTCHIRNDYPTGRKSRYLSDVICRDHCLPCMRVIELGKCPKLIELFKEEKVEDEFHFRANRLTEPPAYIKGVDY